MANLSENLNSENEIEQDFVEQEIDEQPDEITLQQQLRQAVAQEVKQRAKQVAKQAAEKAVKKGMKQAWMAFVRSPYFWPVIGVVLGIIGLILLYFLISGLVTMVQEDPCAFGGLFSDLVEGGCNIVEELTGG